MSVAVRQAALDDFEAVTALLEELGRPKVTDETAGACRDVFENHLSDERAAHLIAEDEGSPVGFCSLHFRDRLNHPTPDAWIPDLIVTAAARRRGVARLLLAEAERLGHQFGCHGMTLESGWNRAEAHQLYAAFGMDDAGKYFTKPLR